MSRMECCDVDVASIEERIRLEVMTKGRRIQEYFIDYDNLRSGYVTRNITEQRKGSTDQSRTLAWTIRNMLRTSSEKAFCTQFFRILWQNLGLNFSVEEEGALARRFCTRSDGQINYRLFCNTILPAFDENRVDGAPLCQKLKPIDLFGTTRSLQPQHPEVEVYMESLLRRMQQGFRRSGINLRICCEDVDQPRQGLVTESQFYRFFPRPLDVSEEDIAKLVDKYRIADRPGLINYLNLANDLDAIDQVMQTEESPAAPRVKESEDYLIRHMPSDYSLQELLDHLRVTVFKNRIRVTDFFSDYDPRRTGKMDDTKFVKAVVLAVGKEANLSPDNLQKLIEFYRVDGNCVNYKEFCDMLDNTFSDPSLIKNPTNHIVRPGPAALGRTLAILSETEECRVNEILKRLRKEVEEKRILVYPFFKDFEKSVTSYTRFISMDQFERSLRTLGLLLPYADLVLICRKFADPQTCQINYPGFVQTIDKQFLNYKQDIVKEYNKCPEPPPHCDPKPDDVVDFDHLMARLRHIVLVNRIRVNEFFRDYDPLRTGLINGSVFERCLSALGFDSLGEHTLTKAQFEALREFYTDPQNRDKIMWKKFEQDINMVFGLTNLEKTPMVEVPPSETFVVPHQGTMDWRFASEDQRELTEGVLEKIKKIVEHRGLNIRTFFQCHDKLHLGRVSRDLFRRSLVTSGLDCSVAEMCAIEARFSNDLGVDYSAFCQLVDPVEQPPLAFLERVKKLHEMNQREPLAEIHPRKDVEGVMTKIKDKVYKERIRIILFLKDHDHYNTGRIRKTLFRRALDLCKLNLTEWELSQLEDHFQSSVDSECVAYKAFTEEVESIFTTKELEKCPTLEVERFHLKEPVALNEVVPGNDQVLNCCLERFAKKVREHRLQLFPLFQDFDKLNKGSVTRSQFRRALMELGMADLAPAESEWIALWDKFHVRVGGADDVDYIAFCDVVYGLAGFSFRRL